MGFKTNGKFSGVLGMALIGAALVACGGQPNASTPRPATNATATSGAPASTSTVAATTAATASAMDHGGMNMSAPFDAQFIDSMIEHHQGAIDMAKQAQTQAQRPEIKQMAEAIIKAQQTEIDRMKGWRQAWYPDLADTGGMMMDMGAMTVAEDASIPFDIRFINAMIPHHEGAIAMAKAAQQKAEHPEIKTLADDIVKAQQGEIDQMKQWLSAWK